MYFTTFDFAQDDNITKNIAYFAVKKDSKFRILYPQKPIDICIIKLNEDEHTGKYQL